MRFFSLFLIVLLVHCALGQEEATDSAAVETPDFQKMRVKQLKRFLHERGLVCKGCAEKDDFVKMAVENKDAPLMKAEKPKAPPTEEGGKAFGGDSSIEELLASMKKMGMNGNVFTKDDMEKMNKDGKGYEDMFNAAGAGGSKPLRKKRSKSSSKKTEDKASEETKEQGSETIEL